MGELIQAGKIEQTILLIRGQKVILDADLARLYGITTKRLNEQVKRNRERFPEDFMLRLTKAEKEELVANCDRFRNLKHSIELPYAFTEYGAIMAANVLRSRRAIEASLFVVRAFVKMRGVLTDTRELARRLAALERELKARMDVHETAIVDILQRVMDLIDSPEAPEPPRRPIGFQKGERRDRF